MKAPYYAVLLALVLGVGCGKKEVEKRAKKEAEGGFKRTKDLAEKGDAKAQYNLGLMYAFGEGVLEDHVTAYAWLNLAPANGNPTAKTSSPRE